MDASSLTAISPLDGRYARTCDPFRKLFSEYGLIRLRTFTEVRWVQFLADRPEIDDFGPLSPVVNDYLNKLTDEFGQREARQVKEIEATTHHDVKAVEYLIADRLDGDADLNRIRPFVHFACTSEDINNIAYALMLRDGRDQFIRPALRRIIERLRSLAGAEANQPMLSRTHGQSASPTTLGKELANVIARLERQLAQLNAVSPLAKINGAVGNFNAHVVAYPEVDWPALSRAFIESLGLVWSEYTTQIEPHDWIAEYCDALARINTILLDLCRDLWSYISIGYFRQRRIASEVGSSTMPHKVNPIDFENAEGNLGIANALLRHFSEKLPVSRWQRDLTDSTVLRNLGVGIGHGLLACDSLQKGLDKLQPDAERMNADLARNVEVLGEAVQTVMRRYGAQDAYEQLKELTCGEKITQAAMIEFINGLNIPADARARLAALTPATYIGLAAELAQRAAKPGRPRHPNDDPGA
ncbi:MAG: adenylosuccinate lyase [Gammaproteobacteria bacterium]|nr:MAG: adenylosuccinate lyase [Gammaproteobacteria bacterium]